MAKLFRVFYQGYSASDVDQLRVSRKWSLPGVKCPVCQDTWTTVGVAYPSVDLSRLPSEGQYRRGWPVPLEELEDWRRPLLELIPEGSVIPPGTELGQLVGTAQGMFADFVWVNPWTLLARPEALEELRKTDVRLPKSVPALLDFKKANVRTLVELELEPRGVLARSSFTEALIECEGCGRIQAKMPERIVVEEALVPSGVDIFRDLIMTTLILATERFVAAVKELKLTGLEFQEVEVA